MNRHANEQEQFWSGEFGDDYTERNRGDRLLSSNIALFSRIFSGINITVNSLIEFGPNIGLNLKAIRHLLPGCELSAVEINKSAVEELKKIDRLKVYHDSIFDFSIDYPRDFVLSKGLLIHLNPDMLGKAYETIYQGANRYICLVEYYNPTPLEVSYRGHQGKLFKRDFAGEMMDSYPGLRLTGYGFVYHRDYNFPQDDVTWFLLEK